jgi:hypothetical protein
MTIMDERYLQPEEYYELRTARCARFIHQHIAAAFREIRFALPIQNNYARKPSLIRLPKCFDKLDGIVSSHGHQ